MANIGQPPNSAEAISERYDIDIAGLCRAAINHFGLETKIPTSDLIHWVMAAYAAVHGENYIWDGVPGTASFYAYGFRNFFHQNPVDGVNMIHAWPGMWVRPHETMHLPHGEVFTRSLPLVEQYKNWRPSINATALERAARPDGGWSEPTRHSALATAHLIRQEDPREYYRDRKRIEYLEEQLAKKAGVALSEVCKCHSTNRPENPSERFRIV